MTVHHPPTMAVIPAKRGRPRMAAGEKRGHVLPVRLTDGEHENVVDCARVNGLRPSEWAREVIVLASTKGEELPK